MDILTEGRGKGKEKDAKKGKGKGGKEAPKTTSKKFDGHCRIWSKHGHKASDGREKEHDVIKHRQWSPAVPQKKPKVRGKDKESDTEHALALQEPAQLRATGALTSWRPTVQLSIVASVRVGNDSQPKQRNARQLIRRMLEPTDGFLCTTAEDGHVVAV